MKPILVLLLLTLSTAADAKPIRAQTLRERVIEDLKNDRNAMIATIELNPTLPEMVASLKARVLADEQRIKELGGTFEPWVWRSALTGGGAGGSSAPACAHRSQRPPQ